MVNYQWIEEYLRTSQEPLTEKQLRIMVAAVRLFSEQGYAATSTKEIAELARVAEGTIFKHYGTKKGLMLSLSRLLINAVILPLAATGLDELMSRDYETSMDFIEALMYNRMTLVERGMPIFRLLLQELPLHPELQQLIRTNISQLSLPSHLQRFQDQGLLIDIPLEQLQGLLLSSLLAFMGAHFIFLPDLLAQYAERDLPYYIDFVARGLGAATPPKGVDQNGSDE